MGTDEDERLQVELELLTAMYPEQLQYEAKSREVKYLSDESSFVLRLPSGYLLDELPDVLSANIGKIDARAQLKQHIQSLAPGEEVLDSLIQIFVDLTASTESEHSLASEEVSSEPQPVNGNSSKATVIVWLHHLLNTNKRKQALSPPAGVSGVTKPGYPGVLIYSGPYDLVHEHVNELKALNWQAFQVRLEDDEEWIFSHGAGVREMEAMKDVVAAIGDQRKDLFMEAMRMK